MVNALMVRGLTHRYPGRGTPALDDLGFDLPENRLAFVLGPNGSGKSTLFRILLRLLRADSGEVEVGGRRLESYGPAALAGVISYIPQSSEVPFNFSGRHTVVLGRVTRRGLRASPREADWKAADEALEAVGMTGLGERGIQELSGGERQLVLIARALCQGLTVLLSSHQPNHAFEFADDVLLLKQGRSPGLKPVADLTGEDLRHLYELPARVVDLTDMPGLRLCATRPETRGDQ